MNDIVNSEMSEYWNGDGGRKWLHFQDRIDASLIPFGQQAMEAAEIVTGERVLDIGCGCGDTSFEIARRVGPDGHVQGIDISERILAQARGRAVSSVASNVAFECADAQPHRFDSMAFDVVYSRFGIMFFDDPVAAFSNIRQAIKPGGRMAFICWRPINANQWVRLPLEVAANHLPLPPQSSPEEPGPFSFGDSNRVLQILAAAGFVNTSIEQYDTTFNVGASLDEAVTFLTHIGPASSAIGSPDVDDTSRTRTVAELRNTLASYKTVNGVELEAATWVVTARNP